MALEEHDREDLLRDGRNMPLRGECVVDGVVVVIGFRREGQVSLYCGPDPVFQFNSKRQLRRVFLDGRRFAARSGGLVELTRETRGGRVQFCSTPLDGPTRAKLLSALNDWLRKIHESVDADDGRWRTAEDCETPFKQRLREWFEELPVVPVIAASPNA